MKSRANGWKLGTSNQSPFHISTDSITGWENMDEVEAVDLIACLKSSKAVNDLWAQDDGGSDVQMRMAAFEEHPKDGDRVARKRVQLRNSVYMLKRLYIRPARGQSAEKLAEAAVECEVVSLMNIALFWNAEPNQVLPWKKYAEVEMLLLVIIIFIN